MSILSMQNPATGETLGTLTEATPEQVEAAMRKARQAFPAWAATPVEERVRHLTRLRHLIVEQGEELARKISADTGKVTLEAYMTEIFPVADFLRYYEKNAAAFLSPKPVKTPLVLWPKRSVIHYKPMGVIAVISPWNYPFHLAMIPVISALAAGNTVILKPSEVTSYTGLLMEDVLSAAGLPDGVVQVLHGGKEVGQALVAARPDKIFFTGSVATGRKIMAQAAEHLIPVELELGGKDPMIVFADAHLERAANAAVWGAFTNSGQVCMSVERVYIEESLFPAFVERIKEKTEALRQGYPVAEIGSMTSPAQVSIVKEHLAEAVRLGATIVTGGRFQEDSMFLAPTILTNVNHDMKVMREETFGPVLPVNPFRTEEEAIRLANDSPYGLNASVWSADLARARRVALRLESGNVCINDVIITAANPHLPFGGVKQSGFGRYHGPEGLHTFCHIVSVAEDAGKRRREINWYPYTREQEELFIDLTRFLYGKSRPFSWNMLRRAWHELKRVLPFFKQ